jgi:hypothetical protein
LDNKDNDYFHRCPTDSCTYYSDDLSDDLSEYIQSGSTLYITQDDVNKFSAYEKDLIALNSEFTKFESGDISFENISLSWKKFFGKDDYFYESYR